VRELKQPERLPLDKAKEGDDDIRSDLAVFLAQTPRCPGTVTCPLDKPATNTVSGTRTEWGLSFTCPAQSFGPSSLASPNFSEVMVSVLLVCF
jgi:hypothetical protein